MTCDCRGRTAAGESAGAEVTLIGMVVLIGLAAKNEVLVTIRDNAKKGAVISASFLFARFGLRQVC